MQKNTVAKASNKPEIVAGRCLALWYVGSSVSTMMSPLMRSPLQCITNTNMQRQRQQNNLNLGTLRHQKPMMSRWLHLFTFKRKCGSFHFHSTSEEIQAFFHSLYKKNCFKCFVGSYGVHCTIFTVELTDLILQGTFPDSPSSLTLSSYEDN